MPTSESRFGLGFDTDLDIPPVQNDATAPVITTGDEEPISPADIAAQTASHLAQTQAAEAAYEAMPVPERIQTLLKDMGPRRRELLAIMTACATPRNFAEIEAAVAPIQENCKTVFDAARLCSLLEQAGAIERITEDGEPYPTGSFEPQVVENEDGTKSLQAVEAPEPFWRSTPEGAEAAEADDPLARVLEAVKAESQYLPIYLRAFEMCAADGGTSAKSLGEAIDHDPLVQEPRLFAMHFIGALEDNDAVTWDGGSWRITEVGQQAFEQLAAKEA